MYVFAGIAAKMLRVIYLSIYLYIYLYRSIYNLFLNQCRLSFYLFTGKEEQVLKNWYFDYFLNSIRTLSSPNRLSLKMILLSPSAIYENLGGGGPKSFYLKSIEYVEN